MKQLLILFSVLCISTINAQEFETIIEEFDDFERNLTIENNSKGTAVIEDGVYRLANKEDRSRVYYVPFIVDPLADYSIEIKIKQTSGLNYEGFGLVWGHYNWDNYLRWYICSNNQYKVEGKRKGTKISEQSWTFLDEDNVIHPLGDWNILRVEQKDDKLKFYINNKLVDTRDKYMYIGHKLGFMMRREMTIEVDYLKVTRKKQKLNLVENPINGYKLENLGENINSDGVEKSPVISPDGKTIYFCTESDLNLGGKEKSDIWYSKQDVSGNWMPKKQAPSPLNNKGHNFVISVSPDGNTLLVGNRYKSDGSIGGKGVSISHRRNGKWQIPQSQTIDNYVNDDKYVNFFLTTDKTKLIMSIENERSFGQKDIMISFLESDGSWSEPRNMGRDINTFANDFSPYVASDGKTMYFSSYGHEGYGSADIFVTKRLDDTWMNWSEPKNLGPEINSSSWDAYFSVSAQGDYAYMVSSNEELSMGDGDIFRIKLSEDAKPEPVVMVTGKVYNAKTNEPIAGEIVYENLNSHKQEGMAYSTVEDGFKIILPHGNVYGFRAEAEGYIPVSENLDLNKIEIFEEKKIDLYLVPIEKGQTVRLNNIFFDFDKATLKESSRLELNRLVTILNNNPNLNIQITGHTDNKGNVNYNMNLSNQRANAVMQYLIEKNINKSRLSHKGYGETKPVRSNDTEEGRHYNRRVEFVIQ